MPTALRHPGFACRHTPALGARATPPPLPRSATDIGQAWDIGQPPPGQASDRHSSRVRSPFGHQTGLPMPRSPDVRGCLPGIRSLDADRASPSWLRLSSHAGSRGTGNPSTTTQSNPAAMRPTSRGLEDRGRPFGQPSALPATGQAKTGRMPVFRVYTANGQDARVSRRHRAQHPAVWRTAAARSGNPRRCPQRAKRKRAGCPCFACS
jgi:hypothetical protein